MNPGRRTMKLMTAATGGKLHRTRSPLEDRFVRVPERWGAEEPECNVHLEGYEVDFLWRRVGLAVELDGLDAPWGRGRRYCATGGKTGRCGEAA